VDILTRERDNVARRRGWGGLLLFGVGLALAVVALRGPAGMVAAMEKIREPGEADQASPLAASTGWMRVTNNLSGARSLLSVFPDVAVSSDGQHVAVVWQEQAPGDGEEQGYVYIRCASEGTPLWGAKRAVPGSYGAESEGQRRGQMPAVALYGDQVHVVWSGGYNGDYDKIYYQIGTIGADNAVTWDVSSPQTIADESGTSLVVPDVAVGDGGQPHVVWQQEDEAPGDQRDIYYSALSGSTWGSPERVSREVDAQNQDPAIAVEGTTAYVAWVGGASFDADHPREGRPSPVREGVVYVANSDDGWAAPYQEPNLSDSRWMQPQHPSIAAMNGQVGVVWETWNDNLSSGDEGYVDDADKWWVNYIYRTQSVDWSSAITPEGNFGSDFYPHFDGDEYVQSVRPSLAYVSDPGGVVPYVALSRTHQRGLSYPMVTYYWEKGPKWSEKWVMPRGGSAGDERGAARLAIGRFGNEDHVHFVYQAVVGVDEQGQNRWDVFYTSDEIYNVTLLPTLFRNHR
jgi:hypothetical protein